jgi:uncharacterized protein
MIIVDTGAFVALFNQRDTHHGAALSAFGQVSEPLITTYPVITETCYLLIQLVNQMAQRRFLRALCQDAFQIFQLDRDHLERMAELMEQYADLLMDLADASLVVLAEHLKHGRIWTVDRRDFSTYRWNKTQTFESAQNFV